MRRSYITRSGIKDFNTQPLESVGHCTLLLGLLLVLLVLGGNKTILPYAITLKSIMCEKGAGEYEAFPKYLDKLNEPNHFHGVQHKNDAIAPSLAS